MKQLIDLKKPDDSAEEVEKAKSIYDLIEDKVLAITKENVKEDELDKKKKEILTEFCKVTGKKPPSDDEEKKEEKDKEEAKEEEKKDNANEQEEEKKDESQVPLSPRFEPMGDFASRQMAGAQLMLQQQEQS